MRAVARIDLDAVRGNLSRIRDLAGSADVMTVVKADAYGHGMVEISRVARDAGVTWLGVALPSEALALRASGDSGRILAWLWTPGDPDIEACLRADVDISVSSSGALAEVVAAAQRTSTLARVHIKIDTGLTRNGVAFNEVPAVLEACRAAMDEGILDVVGLWSHLADGDTPQADSVRVQRECFEQALELAASAGVRPAVRHLANSGALFAHPDCRYDLVRTGIALYGLTPSPALGTAEELGLTPAMSLVAQLAHVKSVEAGTSVSYGWRWTAGSATQVGLVPVGYADGLPRAAGAPRTGPPIEVAIRGRRVPIVGTVAMDQCVVDLGAGSDATAGSEVVLFGPGRQGECSADAWAETIGTIGYEVVTRIGPRVPREYVDRSQGKEGRA
jgi:alanine racemase